jgi:nucleoid DNA-binding protein
MNHQQMITEISKRLPYLKRRDVAEVLAVMTELWLTELAKPSQTISVADLGKLAVEVQRFRSGGAVGQRAVRRIYVRFRPTEKFRQIVLDNDTRKEAVE